ncbi:metallophosphoesterase family protein [Desulfovibrio inopinatus]|uniref:metallophosphoesterase family protein n=1 Tax=Desulfovibrio inopinatus TaxID=102109 RepID=UPI000426C12A|nr:metallophosphoesterase [Desulfovibrio inopinatus]
MHAVPTVNPGMTLLLGDVHGDFDIVNRHIYHAKKSGICVKQVVQFGDLGASHHAFLTYFKRRSQQFAIPFFFIDGNHEDFFFLGSINRRFGEYVTYLERGSVHQFGWYNALCLGGSAYMDPINTPPAAVIQRADIDRSLAHDPDTIDIIFSHDSPQEAGVSGRKEFKQYGQTGFSRGGELLERYRPKLWVFAHHHQYYECMVGDTRFVGLDLAARGYVLLGAGYYIKRVRHIAGALPDRDAIYCDRPGRSHPLEGALAEHVARKLSQWAARALPRRRKDEG